MVGDPLRLGAKVGGASPVRVRMGDRVRRDDVLLLEGVGDMSLCRKSVNEYHVTHLYDCICAATYCMSCHWGCPTCGVGKGVNRRAAPRATASIPMEIQLHQEDEDED